MAAEMITIEVELNPNQMMMIGAIAIIGVTCKITAHG